jgi:hypothetical protein
MIQLKIDQSYQRRIQHLKRSVLDNQDNIKLNILPKAESQILLMKRKISRLKSIGKKLMTGKIIKLIINGLTKNHLHTTTKRK